jgi:hypothetical protein
MALQSGLNELRDALLKSDERKGSSIKDQGPSTAEIHSIELIEKRVHSIGDPTILAVFDALKELPQSSLSTQNPSTPLPLTPTFLFSALLTLLSSALTYLRFSLPSHMKAKKKKKPKSQHESSQTQLNDNDNNNYYYHNEENGNPMNKDKSVGSTSLLLAMNNSSTRSDSSQRRHQTRTLAALQLLRLVLPT